MPVEDDYLSLPPEPQMGNIEYKLKLVNPSATRLQHLVTQVRKLIVRSRSTVRYTQRGRSAGTHMSGSVPPVPGKGRGGGGSSRIRFLIFWLIWDPGYPGVQKAPDPGPEYATLFETLLL